jgi:hypothetical protein
MNLFTVVIFDIHGTEVGPVGEDSNTELHVNFQFKVRAEI